MSTDMDDRGNGHSRVNAYVAKWTQIAAAIRFNLALADEDICDAYATADSHLPEGTPVEVKSTRRWIGNGAGSRMRGRFTFSPTHADLAAAGGEYALVLYDTVDGDPEEDGRIMIYRISMVSAETIDALIDAGGSSHPKLGWPHVFKQVTPPR